MMITDKHILDMAAAPAAAAQVPVEGLSKEQLVEQRHKRQLGLAKLKTDTAEQASLARFAQQIYESLVGAEDVLLELKDIVVEGENRDRLAGVIAKQRKVVQGLTDTFKEHKIMAERGGEAVQSVFIKDEGGELTGEEQQRLKEFDKAKEKEQEQLKQQQLRAQQQYAYAAGGRGRGRFSPYSYGSAGNRPQYSGAGYTSFTLAPGMGDSMMGGHQVSIVQTPAVMPQMPMIQQPYVQQPYMMQQPQYIQSSPLGGQGPRMMYTPPGLVRAPRFINKNQSVCHNCGKVGHFGRDGLCIPADVEAWQVSFELFKLTRIV